MKASSLDDRGRCCGRKPLVYKRPPHRFCFRCDRAYGDDGQQISNWAFKVENGEQTCLIGMFGSAGAQPFQDHIVKRGDYNTDPGGINWPSL